MSKAEGWPKEMGTECSAQEHWWPQGQTSFKRTTSIPLHFPKVMLRSTFISEKEVFQREESTQFGSLASKESVKIGTWEAPVQT
jgi:hypothetical protein